MRCDPSPPCPALPQPMVDAASSTDPVHGWGPPGGIVFQKEFLELFCSAAKVRLLLEVLEQCNETVAEQVRPRAV